MTRKNYVVGFVFNGDKTRVVLKYGKDATNRGCWNGVGGSVGDYETPINAMVRESEKEGLIVGDFKQLATIEYPDCRLHFFYGYHLYPDEKLKQDREKHQNAWVEINERYGINTDPTALAPNVWWLLNAVTQGDVELPFPALKAVLCEEKVNNENTC